jgi:hypothetical protein
MKRPYTKIVEIIKDFRESGEAIREIDTTLWASDKTACCNIRRTIRQKGFKDICVVQRGDRVFVMKM